MSVDVSCTSCSGRFRVPDTAAGKRIKCPKCKSPIDVPGTQANGTWTLKTEEGDEYGPVARNELDAWYAEGRVTADCQLLLTGSAQWQWATDLYPALSEPSTSGSGEFAIDTGDSRAGSSVNRGRGSSISSLNTGVANRKSSPGRKSKGKTGPQEPRNKTIDILATVTYVLGGLQVVGGIMFMVFGSVFASLVSGAAAGDKAMSANARQAAEASGSFMLGFFFVIGVIVLLSSVLIFMAGYGLSKRKSWGRILTLVLAGISLISGPIQLAYGIWAFVVLLDKKNADEFS